MSTVFPESPLGSPATMTFTGYRGPMAHTYTPGCAGHHPPSESCPATVAATTPLPPKWAEATVNAIGEAAHAGYCRDDPCPDWDTLDLAEQLRWISAGHAAATRAYRSLVEERDHLRAQVRDLENHAAASAPGPGDGGRWERIAFMGHLEYSGWVTEVTRNGQPAYRIELPDYMWGDDKSAWVEHSAASWFSSNPVNDRALRRDWEARRRRLAEVAEWEARQKARALPAAEDDEETEPTAEDAASLDDVEPF